MKNYDKERFKSTIHYLNKVSINGYIDDIKFSTYEEKFEDYWPEITEDSEIYIAFKHADDYPQVTISELINATELLKHGILDYDRGVAKSNSEILFRIEPANYIINNKTTDLMSNLLRYNDSILYSSEHYKCCLWGQNANINDTQVSISVLTETITFYNLLLEKEQKSFEFSPAYHDGFYFICVEFERDITLDCAEALADAFLFELYATLGIHFIRRFATEEDYEVMEYCPENMFAGCNCNSDEEVKIRLSEIQQNNHKKFNSRDYSIKQILHGKGMHDVIKIFNDATNTHDYNYKILCFSRIIEFIAPTVARKKLINSVLSKLAENNENEPNADLVMELGGMYRKFDTIKDKELCRITISSIIDISEIKKWITAPIRNWNDFDNPDKNEEILKRIADSINATRNEIAHAKSTYTKTGLECAEEHKGDFAIMMQKIAEHLIRWFYNQPIETRVIGS